ncbi:nitric oxide reductase activation protein NorD [Scopulibacillus cellulosilyticus]|uniref:VWFA domain-containing protein n=1 Tax=Scopulibacillus cellulosilyticus TaxID=2665665 RepID=A0ABW2Q1B3_9BACL
MKFLNFMEKRIDPFLKIELTDLAKTLASSEDLKVDFAFHSYYRKEEDTVTVSHYWTRLLDESKKDGMKSDIYLRAFGNLHFTDYQAVSHYLSEIDTMNAPSFRKQIFCFLEDMRLEKVSCEKRPGMIVAFQARHDLFHRRFRERFSYHKSKNEWLDALFCAFYLQFIGKPIALPQPIAHLKPIMRKAVSECPKAEHTADIRDLAILIGNEINKELGDMEASYLTMYESLSEPEADEASMEEKNELISDSSKQVEDKEDKEAHKEKMPSWHQEQEQEGDNFLQFDLDEGQKTDLIGEGERKSESGDQALASVQGASKDSEGNQFDENQMETSKSEGAVPSGEDYGYAEVNRNAKAIIKGVKKPNPADQQAYKNLKAKIQPVQKSLQQSIQKTIEQKQIAPRTDLHFGRLNKKLLRIVTDDNPRLFYKKQEPSTELDVVFSLLVDCSASMYDKMEETQAGIALFHESLLSLGVPHAVTGFWEDALSADDNEQPNIFLEVIKYEKSLLPGQGANILQLHPEEDNRDGFAIRTAAKELLARPEKHKILLVFTDGEPSAFDYSENGIVDTQEAVLDIRKKGIEVIGVFLSNEYTQDSEKETMQNIYGRQSLIIPTVEEIPSYITPLLKKLLYRFLGV